MCVLRDIIHATCNVHLYMSNVPSVKCIVTHPYFNQMDLSLIIAICMLHYKLYKFLTWKLRFVLHFYMHFAIINKLLFMT